MGRGGTIWHLEMEDNDWMYEDGDEGLDDDEEEIDEIGVVLQGEAL
tara:strand:- start:231 stop:368 length:138 start_codon:yes stop_codon:yes gene_type:complete